MVGICIYHIWLELCLVGPVICDSFWLRLVVLAIDCLWWLLIRMSGFTQISVKIIVLLSSYFCFFFGRIWFTDSAKHKCCYILFSFSSCPFPGSVLMAAMAQNGLSSNSDAWFTLRICSNVSSLNLVDPNICCYLLQTDLSDAFPFCAAVISVSHLDELYLGCFYICIPYWWVGASCNWRESFFLLFRKENRSHAIEDIHLWTSDYWTSSTGQDNVNCPILGTASQLSDNLPEDHFFYFCSSVFFYILYVHLCFVFLKKTFVCFK